VHSALTEHIEKVAGIKVANEAILPQFFKPVFAKKKENLLEADRLCSSLFFVVKGCLRLFFIDEKGVQHTTQFAIENWWLTDFLAFHNQKVTGFYIQAVEPTEALVINLAQYEQLLEHLPALERYFRIIYQRGYGASQMRMKYNHDMSREELYKSFASQYPGFIQRIPQYLLASFLGFTPEYLSELRKKRS
jgi:CRP-like cAMP-binding protein